MARQSWTPEMRSSLVSMAGEKATADDIAASLGITVRSVLGYARRWCIQIGDGEQKNPKWTAEEVAQLRDMVAEGKTAPAIAQAMGRSNTSIWARCHALEIRPANVIVNGWTDDDINTLREMASAGCRSREVAAKLGRKRESVLAKARDVGVAFRIDARPSTLPPVRQVEPTSDVETESGGIPFLALDFAMQKCRRPLWSDGGTPPMDEQRYCGQQTAPNSSWCPECAKRMSGGFLGKLQPRKAA